MLYQNVWPQVLSFVLKNSGDHSQAEDLFHDSVMKLIKKIRSGDIEGLRDVYAYTYTIARNSWYTKTKRDERVQFNNEKIDYSAESDEFNNIDKKEKADLMDSMLSELGETCKDLLKLTFYMDYSLKEAAELMGLSGADVAKTYQYRCKKKLFNLVKDNEEFKAAMGI